MHALPLRPDNIATRLAWLSGGMGAAAVSVALLGPWALALWLLPDLALLLGFSRELSKNGRLARRAVPLYNAAHALPGPLIVAIAGLVASPSLLGLGLIWLSHVAVDRACGYGLRDRHGFQRA
jgi:hypothetical protein